MIEANSAENELKWVNRLSDFLFVLARYLGYKNGEKEAVWKQ